MKLKLLSLSLIITGNIQARDVQYAIKNKMKVPTELISVNFKSDMDPENPVIKRTFYTIPIDTRIKPDGLYIWYAENTQRFCNAGPAYESFCTRDAYPYGIAVNPVGKPTKYTPLSESYDDMFWVINPDGSVKRVYQIYHDGTVIPFKNDDHTQGPVDPKDYLDVPDKSQKKQE